MVSDELVIATEVVETELVEAAGLVVPAELEVGPTGVLALVVPKDVGMDVAEVIVSEECVVVTVLVVVVGLVL